MRYPAWTSDPKLLAAAALALLIGMGTAFAVGSASGDGDLQAQAELVQGGCRGDVGGADAEPQVRDSGVTTNGDRAQRTVRVTLTDVEASAIVAGLCTSVGEIVLRPSVRNAAQLVIQVEARGDEAREAVDSVPLSWAMRTDGQRLAVTAWPGQHHSNHQGTQGPTVHIALAVPTSIPVALDAQAGVGDVEVEDVVLQRTSIQVGTGDIEVEAPRLLGDGFLAAGVGDIDVGLDRVSTGTLHASAGTGDIDLHLPQRSDTGYDLRAESGVGSVDVDIGPTEHRDHDKPRYGPGESLEARSQGYEEKVHRMRVTANAGVGDVDISADR